MIQRSRGRPKKDVMPPTVTEYRIGLSITLPSEEAKAEKIARAGKFVLITSLDETEWNNAEVLIEYKGQTAEETDFAISRRIRTSRCAFGKSSSGESGSSWSRATAGPNVPP